MSTSGITIPPLERLEDEVIYHHTGLAWKKDIELQKNRYTKDFTFFVEDAERQVINSNKNNDKKWRLPTKDELEQQINEQQNPPDNTPDYFWTSTQNPDNPETYWRGSFKKYKSEKKDKYESEYYCGTTVKCGVWLVRDITKCDGKSETEKKDNSMHKSQEYITRLVEDELIRDILFDENFTQAKFREKDSETQFIYIIGKASRWNTIERVWDKMAKSVMSIQTEEEKKRRDDLMEKMKQILSYYNIVFIGQEGKGANLINPNPGDSYNRQDHQKAEASEGDIIEEILLPGLRQENGDCKRKSIVKTGHG